MSKTGSEKSIPGVSTRLEYNVALDGLRGVALVAILFYHSGVNWIPGGFLSVSTFFTLSGFLITSLLLYEFEGSGRIDLRGFWNRRLRRLMPGALAALIFIALLGGTIGDASQVERLRGDGLAALLYVSNWRFIRLGTEYRDLFASPSLVQHFWSLSIEEQFYLLFPLLFAALMSGGGRRALTMALVAGTLASALSTAWLFDSGAAVSRLYFGTDTRLAEILVGALFAVRHAGRAPATGVPRQVAMGLGAIGLASTFFYWFSVEETTPWLWRGGLTIYAVSTVAVIAGCMQTGGLTRRLLSLPPLPWLGRISYGVYLYHFPVYVTVTTGLTGLDPWPLFALRVGLTFALAVASYHWLEQPVRIGQRLRGRAFPIAVPIGMSAAAVALVVSGGNLAPLVPSIVSEHSASADGQIRLLVIGDSVALKLAPHFRARQSELGFSVRTHGGAGCGIMEAPQIRSWALQRVVDVGRSCAKVRERWWRDLRTFEPSAVLIVDGWAGLGAKLVDGQWLSACDSAFRRSLTGALSRAVEALQRVDVAAVIATAPPAIVEDLGSARSVSGDWSALTRQTQEAAACQNAVRREVAARTGARIVDLAEQICPAGHCRRKEAGVLLSPDGLHYTGPGADIVARWLLGEVRAIVAAHTHSQSG